MVFPYDICVSFVNSVPAMLAQVLPPSAERNTPRTRSAVPLFSSREIAYNTFGLEELIAKEVRPMEEGSGSPVVSCFHEMPLSVDRQMPFLEPCSVMVG